MISLSAGLEVRNRIIISNFEKTPQYKDWRVPWVAESWAKDILDLRLC